VLIVRVQKAKALEFMTSVVVSELYFTDTNCEDGNSTFKAARDKKGEEKTHNDGEF